MHFLILDDNAVDRRQLKDALRKSFDGTFEAVETIGEAETYIYACLARNDVPELIFVDYYLGEGPSGMDFVMTLRRLGVHSPVIILTGIAGGHVQSESEVLGLDVIEKDAIRNDALVKEVCLKSVMRWSDLRRQQITALSHHKNNLLNMTSQIAHDLLNVVASLKTAYELLVRDAIVLGLPETKAQRSRERVAKDVLHASYLAEQLCSFGEMSERVAEPELEDMLQTLEALVETEASEASAFAPIECERGCVFPMDGLLLSHLFRILNENASKHAGTSARIYLRASESVHNGQRILAIEFEDDGCGIPVEDRERIFEPGEKLSPKSSGFGLGLAAASRIISRHQFGGQLGRISCIDPKVGKGACFRMIFPGPLEEENA